jgi:hypothetical protein
VSLFMCLNLIFAVRFSRSLPALIFSLAMFWFRLNAGAVEMPLRDGDVVGVPWEGAIGVPERLAEIMSDHQSTHGTHGNQQPHVMHPLGMRDLQNLPDNSQSPDSASWPSTSIENGGPITQESPQATALSFTGATWGDTGAFPPDSMGAVGPAQYIVAVNGRIRSFNKQTGIADGVLNLDTDVFFNSVMTPPAANNFTSDPRIRYDRLSGRWFIIMIDVPGKAGVLPNRVMLAVSSGSVITTNSVWTFFSFQHDQVAPAGDTGKFADYPTLGIDANALYIGVNIFGTTGTGSFSGTTVFVVRKSSVLGAGPIVVTAFRGLIPRHGTGPYTPQGVDNYDPAATEGYIIAVDSSVYGQLDLRRISNPGGTPSISANIVISVPLNGPTITVPHLGNTNGANGNLDGLDYRLLAAHFRNGRLWTSANMAVDNNGTRNLTSTRMGVRWYELGGIPTGQTPTTVQSGTVFESSPSNSSTNRYYWMGTVMVSGQGHAALGFSVAGVNERANAGTVGRLKNDPLGTTRTPVLYTASTTPYNPGGDPGGSAGRRWGDYSYTCLDPDDDMTMWTIQEFCNATNSYGVRVVRLLAPPPALPTNCSPASVAAGATNVAVVVFGQTDGDTGFFDPGNGFSNRLAVAVDGGGVTVNSVAFNNPTNLTINLSIAPDASGTRTITVTNPDGQSSTSVSGILTIVGSTNHPPVLSAISDKTVNEGSLLTFTNVASDSDANALTFSLDPGAPAGAGVGATNGVFTWTPDESQGPGTNTITIRVTDNGFSPLQDSKTFTVVVNEVNEAPLLSPVPDQFSYEGTTLLITNSASDSDLPANLLTFSLDPGAPTNAAVDPATGVFSWTPTEAQGPGTNQITIRVADNGNPSLSATQTFTVVVLESNQPPVLLAIADRTVYVGFPLVITNSATDPDIPSETLTYALTGTVPAGAAIDPVDGVFTWTPGNAFVETTNTITVRVSDNGIPIESDTKSFLVVVVSLPTIESVTLSNDVVTLVWTSVPGQSYRLQYTDDLAVPLWIDLAGDVTASGSSASKDDDLTSASQKFYRVQVLH